VLSGRGVCDGLIIRSEDSYRLWRVAVCDQETSYARRLKPDRGLWNTNPQWVVAPGEKKYIYIYDSKLAVLDDETDLRGKVWRAKVRSPCMDETLTAPPVCKHETTIPDCILPSHLGCNLCANILPSIGQRHILRPVQHNFSAEFSRRRNIGIFALEYYSFLILHAYVLQ